MDKPIQEVPTEIITTKGYNIDKKKHNYKLSKEDEESILTMYYLNKSTTNLQWISNKYGISVRQIYNIRDKYKKNKDEVIERVIKNTSKNFKKKNQQIMNELQDIMIEKIRTNPEDIALNQLATTFGIIYDKTALEDGRATSNNAFSINIKIDK